MITVPDPILRQWRPDDASRLVAIVRGTDDLGHQFGDADLTTEARARDFLRYGLGSDSGQCHWAIVEDGLVVGNVGLSAIERRHETAWASYWLDGSVRGRGYATRALASVAAWAFGSGLYRVELGHRLDNPASCRVATRAGFATEGFERGKLRYGTQRHDVERHARLRTDEAVTVLPLRLTC